MIVVHYIWCKPLDVESTLWGIAQCGVEAGKYYKKMAWPNVVGWKIKDQRSRSCTRLVERDAWTSASEVGIGEFEDVRIVITF